MKHCNFCNADKPDEDFHWRNKKLGLRIARCKICWSEYTKQHYNNNKKMYVDKARRWNDGQSDKWAEFLITYLRSHPCVDCGEPDPAVLTFDHVRGEKEFNISNAASYVGWSAAVKEIEKCDIRCANCHMRKTAERGNHRRFRFASLM